MLQIWFEWQWEILVALSRSFLYCFCEEKAQQKKVTGDGMKSQCHYSVESHKTCFVEDDDEVHDDNNESFWQNGCPTKGDKPYLQPPPLLEVLIIRNHPHTASRILTCGEPKFKLCPTKLCSSDNHYNTEPHCKIILWEFRQYIMVSRCKFILW